jgi:hypothetical protein
MSETTFSFTSVRPDCLLGWVELQPVPLGFLRGQLEKGLQVKPP